MQPVDFIVLGQTKLNDTSVIIHSIAENYGRQGFVTRYSKKNSSVLYLPLNILEGSVSEKNKPGLMRLHGASLKSPLFGIRSNVYKNTMTLFMSEVLFRVVREGADVDGLYPWCVKKIMTLDALEADFSNFHIRFLIEFASVLGFTPSVDDVRPFAGAKTDILSGFINQSFEEAMMIPLSGCIRNELADIILRYIEYHIGSAINIRSLKVLRELFL